VREVLGGHASVVRSQPYYLDVTPAGTNKGTLVAELARRLAVPSEEIVTLGDMENDVAMFRNSGFSIAMGNATEEVKRAANAVTVTNDQDGFAAAIEQIVLPRAAGS
jgi:hydroxymethylpyrimidine pyrophosphatase-like HAD family hydrolase